MFQRTATTSQRVVQWTPRARHLVIALVIGLAVTACGSGTQIGGTATPHATATPTQTPTPVPSRTWRIIPSPTSPNPTSLPNSQLAAVSALAPPDAWAVGFTYADGGAGRTLIERWDGATWHVVPSPSTNLPTNVLQGVAAVSPRDVWAVGTASVVNPLGATLIEHWNGTQWSIVPSPNPSSNDNGLSSVAAIATNDVWAVGTYGPSCCSISGMPLIERWDGAAWHVVANPALPGATYSTLTTVATIPGTKQLWAVGSVRYGPRPAYEQALIEWWDGTTWHVVAPPAPPSGAFGSILRGVVALSPTDAWAVGEYTASDHTRRALIEHWNGATWQVVSSPDAWTTSSPDAWATLWSVTAAAAWDVRAVGSFADGTNSGQAKFEQWDGTAWHITASPAPSGALSSLDAVTTDGAGNFWAVGSSRNTAGNDYFAQTLTAHCP